VACGRNRKATIIYIYIYTGNESNPKMAMAKEAMLSMDVKLGNRIRSDIVKVATGAKNYVLNFYLSQANLEKTLLADTTAYRLAITKEPALDFGLIAKGVASNLLTFVMSGTLPREQCSKYAWFCACVAEGPDATYTDSVKINNCKCKDGSDKTACFPGAYSDQFLKSIIGDYHKYIA
jgi:hypothetical protein